jgi:predicted Zn-dependent protease
MKRLTAKRLIRDFFISGIIQDSLLNIREIGNDFKFFPTFCIKGGQQVPVCVGSPTVVIDSLNIGALNYGM